MINYPRYDENLKYRLLPENPVNHGKVILILGPEALVFAKREK